MGDRAIYNDPAVVQATVHFRVRPGSVEAKPWDRFQVPEDYVNSQDDTHKHIDVDAIKGVVADTDEVTGRRWSSSDQRQVIGLKQDQVGVTFNRGEEPDRPAWSGWEESLRPEALEVWRRFRETNPSAEVERVGLRYINRFDLPPENLVLSQYFRTIPDMSADMPGMGMSQFMLQLDVPQPDQDADVRLILVRVEPPADRPDRVSVILDIDASRSFKPPQTLVDNEVEAILEMLHGIENAVFESAITNASRNLMQPTVAGVKPQ